MITIKAELTEDGKSVEANFHFSGTDEMIVKESAAVIQQLPKNLRIMSEALYHRLMYELLDSEFVTEDEKVDIKEGDES